MAITNIDLTVLNQETKQVLITWNWDGSSPSTREVDYGPTSSYGSTAIATIIGPNLWRAIFNTTTQTNGDFHYEITMDADTSGDQVGNIPPLATLDGNFSPHASGYPTNLTIAQSTVNEMKIIWDAPTGEEGISGYRVERSATNDEVFFEIGKTIETQFIDSGVPFDRENYYRVVTLFSGLDSRDSTKVPQSVTAINISGTKDIQLDWSAPSDTALVASGYRVYRAERWDAPLVPIGSTEDLTYIDSGLNVDGFYYYRVTTVY